MLSSNHIQHTQNKISAAAIDIRKANTFLDDIVSWVDTETRNIVFGTRAQFLRDRSAI
jgi:hypothetical protein